MSAFVRFRMILVAFAAIAASLATVVPSVSHAAKGQNSVWVWGAGGTGQLGLGKQVWNRCFCAPTPTQLTGLSDIVQVQAAQGFTVALTGAGKVYTWGVDWHGQLGVRRFAKVKCTCSTLPVLVRGLPPIKAISATNSHVLALARDGSVWAWGDDSFGQLGLGRVCKPWGSNCIFPPGCHCRFTPGRISGVPPMVAVAAGTWFSLLLDRKGYVWGWGFDSEGQVGSGTVELEGCGCYQFPARTGISGIKAISAGLSFSLAVTDSGKVIGWGSNDRGQLGNNGILLTLCGCELKPVDVLHVGPVSSVSAGTSAFAIDTHGHLWAWGPNFWGELGTGYRSNGAFLAPVMAQPSVKWRWVQAGADVGIGITTAGNLLTWGGNSRGTLGDGKALKGGCACTARPYKVLDGVTAASVGTGQVVALQQ